MEDLLPALSQCPDVIQQSTDWLAVFVGAAATLGGAALGAWLGARGAYTATTRAQRDQLRWDKLEQALMEVEELYYTLDLNMLHTKSLLRGSGPGEAVAFAKQSEFSARPMRVSRIETYVELFFKEGSCHVKSLREALQDLTLYLLNLEKVVEKGGDEHAASYLGKLIASYQTARIELATALRGELKKSL